MKGGIEKIIEEDKRFLGAEATPSMPMRTSSGSGSNSNDYGMQMKIMSQVDRLNKRGIEAEYDGRQFKLYIPKGFPEGYLERKLDVVVNKSTEKAKEDKDELVYSIEQQDTQSSMVYTVGGKKHQNKLERLFCKPVKKDLLSITVQRNRSIGNEGVHATFRILGGGDSYRALYRLSREIANRP